ncbi:MAG: O-antigen ligase family protein [Chloroflexota bacterium]|nr:O-antigen ligase family protein [Chloroflexota bacterium]
MIDAPAKKMIAPQDGRISVRGPTPSFLDAARWTARHRWAQAAMVALRTPGAGTVAVLAIAAGLWLAPGWLPALGLPLLAWAWWRRWARLGSLAATGLDRPTYLIAGLGGAALLPSTDLSQSLPRLLGLWLGITLFLVVFDRLTSEKLLWMVVSWLAVLGVLVAVAGLVGTEWAPTQRYPLQLAYEYLPRLITSPSAPETGAFNTHKLAAALAMLLPLPAAVMLFTPGGLLRLGWGLGTALIAATLLLTQSGSGLFAGVVAIVGLGAWRYRSVRLFLPALIVGALGTIWWITPAAIADALLALPLAPGSQGTAEQRLALWSFAWALIREFPWLGIGIGTFPALADAYGSPMTGSAAGSAAGWWNTGQEIPHAHNLYLQVALDLGLPGLAGFLALLVGAFRLARRGIWRGPTARARGLVAGAAGGMLAYLAYGLVDAVGPGEKPGLLFWLLLATVAAGARLAERMPSTGVAAVESTGAARGAPAAPAAPIGSIIYVSTFEWDYHTARPQQLARALSTRVPVLYVETTGLRGVGRGDLWRLLRRLRRGLTGRRYAAPGIWVFSPLVLPLHGSRLARMVNRALLRDAIRGQATDLGLVNPLLLISVPTGATVDLVGHLGEVASIYDCMDDLTAVPMVNRAIGVHEAQLARRVDTMVAASSELRRLKASLRQDVVVIGQGVDAFHFQCPTDCPPDLALMPRPRLLCAGGIDDRIDFALLDEVARRRPGWSIVLVGPELYVNAAGRVHQPNVHLLGRRAYTDLPAYVQHADVCLIPYRDSRWARACNPVKTLEYLAAGRPVVSTDLPAVVPLQPHVRIARGPTEFVAAVEVALTESGATFVPQRRALTEGASWQTRADALLGLAAAVARRRVVLEREQIAA